MKLRIFCKLTVKYDCCPSYYREKCSKFTLPTSIMNGKLLEK